MENFKQFNLNKLALLNQLDRVINIQMVIESLKLVILYLKDSANNSLIDICFQ